MDNTRKILKENIKKYRNDLKRSGIDYCKSADKFAHFAGIEISTYKKYESTSIDIVPPYENLVRIATALCISIDKLFNYNPPDKTESFLKDIGIHYEKDVKKDVDDNYVNYVLSYPFKSIHVISIDNKDLKTIFALWRFLNLKERTKFEKQFIFMNMVAEWNKSVSDAATFGNKANNIIEQMEELKEWREKSKKEKDIWRNELMKAIKDSYDYSDFRGGK